MCQDNDWWARQFVEGIKEIAQAYDRFCITREIEDLDRACLLQEEINEAYEISLDLSEFIEIGRAWLAKQTLPHTWDKVYE
jgi:hypothetical protein